MTVLIGIDPGISGGLAFYRPADGSAAVFDMPLVARKSGKRDVDGVELARLVERFCPEHDHVRMATAVVEKVGAMTYVDANKQKRGQGAASSFAFGRATGTVIGVLNALHIPILETPPAVWKLRLGLSSNKTDSRVLAQKMFPRIASKFARAKDDGRAEALLLALHGRMFVP